MFETSSEEEDELKPLAERIKSPIGATTGRQRKPVTYNYGGDSDSGVILSLILILATPLF